MTNPSIHYKKGYKYQLKRRYRAKTGIIPPHPIWAEFVKLNEHGEIDIRQDYAWDGPSGPTFDTKSFMRGSLEHDALYQLIRLGLLPPSYKDAADQRLRQICLEDGMWSVRAGWVYQGVQAFGESSTKPEAEPEVLVAP